MHQLNGETLTILFSLLYLLQWLQSRIRERPYRIRRINDIGACIVANGLRMTAKVTNIEHN